MSPIGPSWRLGDPPKVLHQILDRGGVLAIPTFAGYGLAVDPLNQDAVKTVFQIKRRTADKPLPVVADTLKQFERLGADFSDLRLRNLAALWPAALTIVVPLKQPIPASLGTFSLAVRIPNHPELATLLGSLGRPLTATSANRSGAGPCLDLAGLHELLAGFDAMMVDAGRLPGGKPSTIVGVDSESGVKVIRQGSYSREGVFETFHSARTRGPISADSVEIPADGSC